MSEVLRRALSVGSEQILIERAIGSYVNGEVDLNTAARYARVSVRRMMSEMERRNVRLHQSKEMVEASIQAAAKLFDQPKLLRLLEEDSAESLSACEEDSTGVKRET